MQIDERRAEAAPARFTTGGATIPPGAYGEWLAEVVETFGPQAIAQWRGDIPTDWRFEVWLRHGPPVNEPEMPRESA